MGIVGDWDVSIKTPIGSLQILYSFEDRDGTLVGSAAGTSETVPLTDIVLADGGRQVSWRQTVTKPMRLKLEFDVTVDGDRLSGHSRAGRLPRSAVTGLRRN
ncbi:hypothetical protein [Mycolicibacterium sp.]|uniref:hypothetical protein n=1 Tax=Mycolicibacterium sp. TaxID=2320850 RepID=UPI003D12F9B3